jgi:CubicO group peptidase (beta-lactamase class C family)
MTRDQTSHLGSLPEPVRVANSWGLGWHRLAGGAWPGYFGDLLAPEAYGHGGATGTVVWNDPTRALTCVLFTTEPQSSSRRLLARICNAVSAAAI